MSPPHNRASEFYQVDAAEDGSLAIALRGRIDRECAAPLLKKLLGEIKTHKPRKVFLDLSRITYFDDFGALILHEVRSQLNNRNVQFGIRKAPPKVEEILKLTNFGDPELCSPIAPPRRPNFVLRLVDATVAVTVGFRYMVAFLGSVVLAMLQVLARPSRLRVGDTILYMQKTGVDAVPIVGLISFLLGLIMAFVSSLQLEQFGAGIYVASLVALAMVSELGPIMTAIVVAGRSGSAYAAEIGTMRISDEIDALFTMGFAPTLFLAVPRIIAAMIVVPLLTLFADLFAILGGLTISVAMLDLTVSTYISQTIKALTLFEFMWGLMKSVVFAAIVSWVACLRGFQVRGGAQAVGNAATSAVVSGIFLIILFDSIFAVIRSYW